MDNNKETERNRPSEKGSNNDPFLRDQSAAQPGASTISKSKTDEDNQRLTKTGADDFRTNDNDNEKADKAFNDDDLKSE